MAKRKTTRREFLRGESAVEALGDLTHGVGGDVPTASGKAPGADLLIHFTRRAMACDFTLFLNALQYEDGPDRAMEALDLIEQLEDQLTVYRGHSEVSQLNLHAPNKPVAVEWGLFGLLRKAQRLFEQTQGAFDITAGPLSKLWGFYRREGRLPDDDSIAETLQCVGSEYLQFDDELKTIQFAKQGVEINLGGIGKGYALDESVDALQMSGVNNFLFHGGKSSVIARGTQTGGDSQHGWSVGVMHPMRPDKRLGQMLLRDQAFGVSGSGAQHFYHKGKKYGHILDPRSGRPAEAVLSACCLAPNAATADALATAFYVLGPEKALAYCDTRPEIGAIVITQASKAGAIDIHMNNIPDDQWREVKA